MKKVYRLITLLITVALLLSAFTGCSASGKAAGEEYKNLIKSYSNDKPFKQNSGMEVKEGGGVKQSTSVTPAAAGLTEVNEKNNMIKNSPEVKGIPILTYHCIDDTIFGSKYLFVSPAEFDKQMKYLKASGYTPITFRDIELPSELRKISKPIVITLDDGYEDNYTNAYPILKKYNFKATIFLVSDFIGKAHFLTVPEIKGMMDLIDFEDHTKTHAHLTKLTPDNVNKEFTESVSAIEAITNKKVIAASYPFGNHNLNVVNIAKKYFKYAVTVDFGLFHNRPGSDLEIHRIAVLASTGIDKYKKLLMYSEGK